MENSLEKLILQCKKRERVAQKQIYDTFGAVLFSICLRYASSYEDAQDNFQEGFVIIFNKIDQFEFQGSFEGWMKRIMVNLSLEKYRKKTILTNNDIENQYDIAEEESEYFDQDFEYEKLIQLIQTLPNQYRQVFNLYAIENYSHQEIAELLQISVGTSKSNLSRARAILKQKLTSQLNPK